MSTGKGIEMVPRCEEGHIYEGEFHDEHCMPLV
jgi:hypothetical protein